MAGCEPKRERHFVDLWRGDGLHVVELGGGISAAYGARLLADFGADVIKVEAPEGGDEARHTGPFPGDEPHPEKSGLFLYLNFNKRAITLDLSDDSGAELLARLLVGADVLIENLGPGELDLLPLPEGALHQRLVVCSISPYGQDGPKAEYLGSEITAFASGGMMYLTGGGELEPVKSSLNQAGHLSGLNAASATLTAAMHARATGAGQRIDISEQETVAWIGFPALNLYSHTGGIMRRGKGDVTKLVNSRPMETSDGWVMPSYAGLGTWWESFAAFVGVPELLEEPYLTAQGRAEHAEDIDRLVGPIFREKTKQKIFHEGQEWGLTLGALQTAQEAVQSDQLVERGFFIEQDHPVAGRVRMPGMVPFTTDVDRTIVAPAPLLGQHSEDVLGALGVSAEELARLTGAGIV